MILTQGVSRGRACGSALRSNVWMMRAVGTSVPPVDPSLPAALGTSAPVVVVA
jgi:hypothetical protein